jgi:plasmid maintenance system antidote protein VapI
VNINTDQDIVRSALMKYMSTEVISTSMAARRVGVAPQTIQKFLNGRNMYTRPLIKVINFLKEHDGSI